MITIYRNARRTIKNVPDFCGLSSDEKPMDAKNGSTFLEIDTGNIFKFDEEGKNWYEQPQGGGGSGGTTDYTQLENKPSINGITLEGNQTTESLDIIPAVDLGEISGELPVQIPLNAEQIQKMQKDNCIVTTLYSGINLYLRKSGSADTQLVFSGIASNSNMYLLVNASELQGTFNIFNIAEIPSPTGPDDAGKVPTVKPDGTGYTLKTPSGGGSGGEVIFETTVTGLPEYRVTDIDFDSKVITIAPPYDRSWGFGALTVCVEPKNMKAFESKVPQEIRALYSKTTSWDHTLLDSTHIQFKTLTRIDSVNLDVFYLSEMALVDATNLPNFERARVCVGLRNGGLFGYLGFKNGDSLISDAVYSLTGKAYGTWAGSSLRGIGYEEIIIDGKLIYAPPIAHLTTSTDGKVARSFSNQETFLLKSDTVFNGLRITSQYGGLVNGSSVKIIKER